MKYPRKLLKKLVRNNDNITNFVDKRGMGVITEDSKEIYILR
jgi:hypothetical protein